MVQMAGVPVLAAGAPAAAGHDDDRGVTLDARVLLIPETRALPSFPWRRTGHDG